MKNDQAIANRRRSRAAHSDHPFSARHRTHLAVKPFFVDSSGYFPIARHVFHQLTTIQVATPSTAAATTIIAIVVTTITTKGRGSATPVRFR